MKKCAVILVLILLLISLCSCEASGSRQDVMNTSDLANRLQENQPTPNDIEYSLERYNLIRRTYWVNGMRERAVNLPCEVERTWAAQAKMRANKTASSYNNYILQNNFVWKDNIPKDIRTTLDIIE